MLICASRSRRVPAIPIDISYRNGRYTRGIRASVIEDFLRDFSTGVYFGRGSTERRMAFHRRVYSLDTARSFSRSTYAYLGN